MEDIGNSILFCSSESRKVKMMLLKCSWKGIRLKPVFIVQMNDMFVQSMQCKKYDCSFVAPRVSGVDHVPFLQFQF